jgi:circadian clock protein KaiC
MKSPTRSAPRFAGKAPTGIIGLDDITGGGLPRGTATLVEGGPGAGKTIFALQSLVNGARQFGEPGIFVAFEEPPDRILANAASSGWDIPALQRKKRLFLLDAQPPPDQFQSGSFDLGGMLAALGEKVREMGARRIVFDAIDIVLTLLNDAAAERREMFRLHGWLQSLGLTAVITSKSEQADLTPASERTFGFMQFMVECSVILNHRLVQGISQRSLRILKYRGSSFEENDVPFAISNRGLEVAATRALDRKHAKVTKERVSCGVQRLDDMLGGGFYRGASVLVTGLPGTAKTTLGGTFAEAACKRGEQTLIVSFDSDSLEMVRNLLSVNIRLEGYLKKDLLRIVSARAAAGSAEIHLLRIMRMAQEHRARCIVIDPISALSKDGNRDSARGVAERLLDWAKSERITLLLTSLLDNSSLNSEVTPIQISTIADTWIHLNYLVQSGERNRGLSIIKSRGTSHSNQVRELILSRSGVTLADAYTAGGEVLMGTLRWEKEVGRRMELSETAFAAKQKLLKVASEQEDLEARLRAIQHELDAKRSEKTMLLELDAMREKERLQSSHKLQEIRGGTARA